MALVALSASGMPTKDELAEAQVIVGELMADHIAANNKGNETSEAVGDAAMALSGDAEGEAAREGQQSAIAVFAECLPNELDSQVLICPPKRSGNMQRV